MEQWVKVEACFPDGTATVLRSRESACSGDCHKCSGCGAAAQTVRVTARNPIGAKPGDRVLISSDTAPVLAAAALLYVLPLVLFIAGYLIGESLWTKGPIAGLAGFALGLVCAKLYDRRITKTKKTVYTIIGSGQKEGSE